VIEMQRGQTLTHPSALEMPEGFDPSGIPCIDSASTRRRAASHRRHARLLPGLHPTSFIASVEALASEAGDQWLLWGSVGDRPVMFAVDAGAAAEMMRSLAAGELATAIIEPWQMVLERLD
jgi:hypothetical protein